MIRIKLPAALLAFSALLAACGSVPTRAFQFDAVDVDERPLPCIVVIDNDWEGAATKQQFVNVGNKDDTLSVSLVFERPEVEVTVAAIQVDPDTGEPARVPRSRSEPSDYFAEPRRLRMTDPGFQFFILPRR